MAKESEYVKSMSEARAKDPKKYDKKKEMYDAAQKKEADDEKYSPMDALKGLAKDVTGMKKGGKTKCMAKGGVTRADGCVKRGHTKGKMV